MHASELAVSVQPVLVWTANVPAGLIPGFCSTFVRARPFFHPLAPTRTSYSTLYMFSPPAPSFRWRMPRKSHWLQVWLGGGAKRDTAAELAGIRDAVWLCYSLVTGLVDAVLVSSRQS